MAEIRINGVVEISKRRLATDDRVDLYDDIIDFGSAQEYRRDY
ncbi:MAG: hypothetical protein C5S47_04365 [Candidatus Methanogasteraceae archaeon]|nr:MAG: hypothetical protein C5S47_04365 [ANME-2 cluster archaeon]